MRLQAAPPSETADDVYAEAIGDIQTAVALLDGTRIALSKVRVRATGVTQRRLDAAATRLLQARAEAAIAVGHLRMDLPL